MEKVVTPDYTEERQLAEQFLTKFTDEDNKPKYLEKLQQIANRQNQVLTIEIDDLLSFKGGELTKFVHNIERNTWRYISMFSDASDAIMPQAEEDNTKTDVYDVLMQFREQAPETSEPEVRERSELLPKELSRRYQVNFLPRSTLKALGLRDLKANRLGSHVLLSGIVTRVGEVQPLVNVVAYTCDKCGAEIYQTVEQRTFLPLFECPTKRCSTAGIKGTLNMESRGSKFVKYQEIRLQELPEQVPVGHTPRSISVRCSGENTRQASPGDLVEISGIFLPSPYTGLQAMKRGGLTCDTFVYVTDINKMKKTYVELKISKEMNDEIDMCSRDPDIVSKLANSIAPEIYGHENVKKALLLLMVGGITRTMKDGMIIRGDINTLLCGDPGVAKSQLLKHIATIAPRAVYATGRGSTGVGLTAAVCRDPVTDEMTLEGGALVLADMGICCIDEFDKMLDSDRACIHEVMEQQTVSIAKAGITTTLNARTAVLAAANPAYGRYDLKLSMSQNLNLPAALLSRFDLIFVLIDSPDYNRDRELAEHVAHVHQTNTHPESDYHLFPVDFIRAYISRARKYDPYIPTALTEYLASAYLSMRKENTSNSLFATPRSLLSILRLSQAFARLRFKNSVEQNDVENAINLFYNSKESSMDDKADEPQRRRVATDKQAAIWNIIRDYHQQEQSDQLSYSTVRSRCLQMGYSQDDLENTLSTYQTLNVIQVDTERTSIIMVS